MKTSEIKSLIRYCLGKVKEQNIKITKDWYGIEWINDKWGVIQPDNEICPLASVLIIKQFFPINSKGYYNFSGYLIRDTLCHHLGVTNDFIFSFEKGLCSLDDLKSQDEVFNLGKYFKAKLNE